MKLRFHLETPILYRYCDPLGTDILKSRRLKVTPPAEFNDPFEFLPKVEEEISANRSRRKCLEWECSALFGFHTAPGAEYLAELSPGGVEFGFGVLEPWRRRGIATEASEAIMHWAREEHQVRRFVLSISPDNVPSLGLAAKLGFRKIGSRVDELDGPEDIFERTSADTR